MVCADAGCGRLERVDMRPNAFWVGLAHELWRNLDSPAGLKILQQHIVPELRIELLLVEHLEQNDILAMPGEWANAGQQAFRVAIEIRYHGNKAATRYLFPEFIEWFIESRTDRRFGRIDAMQNALQRFCRLRPS